MLFCFAFLKLQKLLQYILKYTATRILHQRQSLSLQSHIRVRPCRCKVCWNSEHLFYCSTFTLHERERERFEHASCYHSVSWDVKCSKMTHWCCKGARPSQMDTGSLQSRGDNGHHSSTGTSADTQNHESPQDMLLKIHIYALKHDKLTSFKDTQRITNYLSYVFHSMFQSSLVNKYRHRSHARTLLHSHTGICSGSPDRRNPGDTLEKATKTSENARFAFPEGHINGCSYFDHSVVPWSLRHNGTAQSQGHSCPRCSCSHTGWHSSAPRVPAHKLPQNIHAPLHQIINSHSASKRWSHYKFE